MYRTPFALPFPSMMTSRAMARSNTFSRPVFIAGKTCTCDELYADAV